MRLMTAATGLMAVARGVVAAALLLLIASAWTDADAQGSVRPPQGAEAGPRESPVEGRVPGNALGNQSDADIWRQIKEGGSFNASARNPGAGTLVQYEGQLWREIRNGPLPRYGAWAMLGMIVVLALLFALLGRIRIQHGWSGTTVTRFNGFERAGHWLTASSFVVLALTGLNILYGRSLLIPLIGHEAYASIALWGKYLHNYVAFAFIAGLVIIFVQWVVHNIPNRHDVVWLAKGGGIIVRNVHAPARKFNAGQKIIFWLTILGGASVALSGWALMFPFTTSFMADTFELLSRIGIDLPAMLGLPPPPYSEMMEQQMNQVWHGAMSLFLIAVIIAHIYIGTVGMEGAFQAMSTGEVDLNWAREHHNLWVAKLEKQRDEAVPAESGDARQPAE